MEILGTVQYVDTSALSTLAEQYKKQYYDLDFIKLSKFHETLYLSTKCFVVVGSRK